MLKDALRYQLKKEAKALADIAERIRRLDAEHALIPQALSAVVRAEGLLLDAALT